MTSQNATLKNIWCDNLYAGNIFGNIFSGNGTFGNLTVGNITVTSNITVNRITVTGNSTIGNLTVKGFGFHWGNDYPNNVIASGFYYGDGSKLSNTRRVADLVSNVTGNVLVRGNVLINTYMGNPKILNLENVNTRLKGFAGGITDGQYALLIPNNQGMAVKVKLSTFKVINTLDLSGFNALLTGFNGGFTDGKYAYYVPNTNNLFTRIEIYNFTTTGITTLDISSGGFKGGFTDGTYAYLVPGLDGNAKRITLSDFSTITSLNLASVHADLTGFVGGLTDGTYGYYLPGSVALGRVGRILLSDFTISGVSSLDLTDTSSGGNANLVGFSGGCTDGRYLYLVPNTNTLITRLDLARWGTAGSNLNLIKSIDLGNIDSELTGFIGSFFDGSYVYLVPGLNGKVARIKISKFNSDGVSVLDLTVAPTSDSTLKGFFSGFVNGCLGYLVPNNDGAGGGMGKLVQISCGRLNMPPILNGGNY